MTRTAIAFGPLAGALLIAVMAVGGCSSDEVANPGGSAGSGAASGAAGKGGTGGIGASGGSAGQAGTHTGGTGGTGTGGQAATGGSGGSAGTSTGGSAGAATGGSAGAGNGGIGASAGPHTDSGPITLSTGQTVTGLHITSSSGPCILGNNVSNVHITDNLIGPCGPDASGVGIELNNSQQAHIDHNSFDDVASGFYAYQGTDGFVFDHNYAQRIRGPFPRGQIVQFNEVNGTGHQILCNISDQTAPGYNDGPEDHVNMFKSNGTSASPILIKNNKFGGGGPSTSGGGVMTGDGGGSFVTVDSNIMVNPGQYGIAVAGGHDIKLLNNRIFSAKFAWTNVGAYVWDQYNSQCQAIDVEGNQVNFLSKDGTQNPFWNGDNCGTVTLNNNQFPDLTVTADIWNETFPDCP
jgi:hypothetical protein